MNRTATRNSNNNKNKNNNKINSAPGIVTFLFQLQVATKMFHWQSKKYAEHIAVGELYDTITDLADEIIEMYMGAYSRPRMPAAARVVIPNMTRTDMVDLLHSGIAYLSTRMPRDGFLRNKCDELTGAMAKVLYLLTLE